jgi:hypothetical protein
MKKNIIIFLCILICGCSNYHGYYSNLSYPVQPSLQNRYQQPGPTYPTSQGLDSQSQDFADFLRELANSPRIPASGTRRTPVFGGIGQTAPARY